MSPIHEKNLANPRIALTYRLVPSHENDGKAIRIEFTKAPGTWSHFSFSSVLVILKQIFLPEGYPHSVSDDYIEYQLWDTIQAFASSITGALSTKAIMQGVGVGDQSATALAATLTWLIKDGTGMIGRITFAWLKGQDLDYECKKWRFVADILNDGALTMELIAPYFPAIFTPIVCTAGVAKAIVGVAGGATRAALTQHQARRDNLADVSAKDGSQETLVNLMALLTSLWLLPLIADSNSLTWMIFIPLTVLHLFANYKAVRGIRMPTLNRSRLVNITAHWHSKKQILPVSECNRSESFLLPASLLEKQFSGRSIDLGASLFAYVGSMTHEDWSMVVQPQLSKPFALFASSNRIAIFLSSNATSLEIIKAYTTALLLGKKIRNASVNEFNASLTQSLKSVEENEQTKIKDALINAGWNLTLCQLSPGQWRYEDVSKME